MDPLYLVCDVGTTSVKSSLFDHRGRMAASRAVEYELETVGKDTIEVDPELYWRSLLGGARAVLGEVADSAARIEAVGVCSQGETVILLDHDGEPIRKAIVWMDNRAVDEARLIKEELGVLRQTGMPDVDPMWSAAKLLWVKKHEPDLYRRVGHVVLVQDFVIHRLAGALVADPSLWPTTYLLDIYRKRWEPQVLGLLRLTEEQLPRLIDPGAVAGTLGAEAARALGLPAGIPVVAGGMDQTAAMIGAGNTVPGMVTETTGGALALCTTLSPKAARAIRGTAVGPLSQLPVQPHIVPETYVALQWCQSGGMSLRWIRDRFFDVEACEAAGQGVDSYERVTAAAAAVSPGSEGLLFLPYMAGSGTVPIAGDVRGVFWGLELHHTKAHMARAVMESMGYLLRMMVAQIEASGLACREIRLLGGGARSELWRQIKADITGRPVAAVTCPEAASLGVAMECAVAVGRYGNFDEAVGRMVSLSGVLTPAESSRSSYEAGYAQFVDLHRRLGGRSGSVD